jgi:ADP-L-glycero-D-manno-heptose 6-epimerase
MPKQDPVIVVTGAAGFIGSAVAWRLNSMGRRQLLLVDELARGDKWKNIAPLAYRDYVEKDDFLRRVGEGDYDDLDIEAVIHMGACSSTTEMDVSFLARNNFEYSKTLAQWCLDRPRPVRFIYASSAATYGEGGQGYADDHALLPKLRPLNPYGYSKQMFDLWCQNHGILDNVVGLKFFNVYGPNEYHKGDMRSMVVKAYEQIQASGRIRLFKSHRPEYRDGEQMRDFIYVKDAVEMALFFLDPKIPGGIYNAGSGKARTWLDLGNALFKALGREPQIDFAPMPEILRDRYQYHTEAVMAKLRAAGYSRPITPLEDAIADYAKHLVAGFQPLGW